MSGKKVPKKSFKLVQKRLIQLGYVADHTNSKGLTLFTHPTRPDLRVSGSINDNDARHLIRNLERQIGIARSNKRNANATKARQQSERERAADELAALDAKREGILAKKLALPTGDLAGVDRDLRLELERELEALDRERVKWQRLMTEIPAPLGNTARHRA